MTKWQFSDIRKKKINYKNFSIEKNNPKVLYGLPQNVNFCKSCIVSNQRPNSTIEFKNDASKQNKSTINFNEDGLCDACSVNLLKNSTNWDKRREELPINDLGYVYNEGAIDYLDDEGDLVTNDYPTLKLNAGNYLFLITNDIRYLETTYSIGVNVNILDWGSVTEDVEATIDFGLLTGTVNELLDFGEVEG